jgi:hypothetical protein
MKVKGLKAVFLLAALLLPFTVVAEPTDSFSKAKKLMMEKVYFDHREPLSVGQPLMKRSVLPCLLAFTHKNT